jgi:hypothetical protein
VAASMSPDKAIVQRSAMGNYPTTVPTERSTVQPPTPGATVWRLSADDVD